MRGGADHGGAGRLTVYCIVPRELARLHEALRRHFRDDPALEVVVERRSRERRARTDRRSGRADSLAGDRERRLIRNVVGRRVGERRAVLAEVARPPELPRRLRRYAAQLRFVERIEPSGQQAEDLDSARLVTRFQAGERDVFGAIYLRYFDRVYNYLRVALKDPHEAEDATQQVFMQVLEALPGYERRRQPFRAWLFVVVRNYAVAHLRKHWRIDVEDPAEIDRRRDEAAGGEPQARALEWITDRELVMLIGRLPFAQQQVIVLRYMLGLSTAETAKVLDRTQDSVRMLQSRAQTFLRQRLTALGRGPTTRRRDRARGWPRPAPVVRARRFSLIAPGPSR